jgi:hypothetical protein
MGGNKMKRNELEHIAQLVQSGTRAEILRAIDNASPTTPSWVKYMAWLREVVVSDTARFTIFTRGNSKLPFLSFSSLPGVTCPGAGDCLNWCYSFRAWRYPAAFGRQAQNAWLLRRNPQIIAQAFARAVKPDDYVRLYVDGDFSSSDDVRFWAGIMREHATVRFYGYSKSFMEILEAADDIPSNYMLNLSSGHKHGPKLVAYMEKLPFTRGYFIGVDIGRKVRSNEHGTREVNAALRKAYGSKAFTCPGKCGECTNTEHACGSARFRGIPVIIATH